MAEIEEEEASAREENDARWACPNAVSDAARECECNDDDPEPVVEVVNVEKAENIEGVGEVGLDAPSTVVAVSAPDLTLTPALASSPTPPPSSKFESSIKCVSLSSCSAVNKARNPGDLPPPPRLEPVFEVLFDLVLEVLCEKKEER